jgi:hypothetical protein
VLAAVSSAAGVKIYDSHFSPAHCESRLGRSPAKDPAYLSHARIARSRAGKLSIRVHEWLFRTIAIRNGGGRDATSTPIVVCAVDAAVHANPAAAVPPVLW